MTLSTLIKLLKISQVFLFVFYLIWLFLNFPTKTAADVIHPDYQLKLLKHPLYDQPQQPHYTTDDIKNLIIEYAQAYSIDPALPMRIAECEGGFRWNAKNPRSTASGVFQYLRSTWENTPEGKAGKSVMNPHANIEAAVRHIANKGTSPWISSQRCWKNTA